MWCRLRPAFLGLTLIPCLQGISFSEILPNSIAICIITGTVFAYGQTSSGKTYTMRGSDSEPGITRLAVTEIFHHVQQVRDICTKLHINKMLIEIQCLATLVVSLINLSNTLHTEVIRLFLRRQTESTSSEYLTWKFTMRKSKIFLLLTVVSCKFTRI